MLEPAARAMKRFLGGPPAGSKLASELAEAAANGDARAFLLKRLEAAPAHSRTACYHAVYNAALGRDDEAFRWLNQAVKQRLQCVLYVNVNPEWDRLRSDPRFVAVLRKIGLNPASIAAP
jgi:hypothetical protein